MLRHLFIVPCCGLILSQKTDVKIDISGAANGLMLFQQYFRSPIVLWKKKYQHTIILVNKKACWKMRRMWKTSNSNQYFSWTTVSSLRTLLLKQIFLASWNVLPWLLVLTETYFLASGLPSSIFLHTIAPLCYNNKVSGRIILVSRAGCLWIPKDAG